MRSQLTSHPAGDTDGVQELRRRARQQARRIVARENSPPGVDYPDLGRPARDYEPGGERYRGSVRQVDDLARAIAAGCDPRTEDCPPGTPYPSGGGRGRCRPCRRRGCRR